MNPHLSQTKIIHGVKFEWGEEDIGESYHTGWCEFTCTEEVYREFLALGKNDETELCRSQIGEIFGAISNDLPEHEAEFEEMVGFSYNVYDGRPIKALITYIIEEDVDSPEPSDSDHESFKDYERGCNE